MEPSSPTSTGAISDSFEDRFSAAWDKANSDKGSDTSMFTAVSTEYGADSDSEWATVHEPKVNPIPIQGPSTGADPDFDWNHWANAPSPPKPSSPKEFGLVPDSPGYQMGHVQQPNAGPLTGADPDFDWDYWANAPSPPKPSSLKEISLAPEHQMVTGADPGLWGISLPDDPWDTGLTTKLDSDPNLMAAH
jgi:hypothetical protein